LLLERRPSVTNGSSNDTRLEGLADDTAHPREIWGLCGLGAEQGGDDDDGKAIGSEARPQVSDEGDAIHAWHEQIDEDNAGVWRIRKRLEARVPVVSDLDAIAVDFENALQESSKAGLVVDHQHASSQINHP
jgi:hypothetical protein